MQTEALLELVLYFKDRGIDDILVYTGYKLEELKGRNDGVTNAVLANIAVLIDGEYVEERDTGHKLIGSDNQVMHFLNGDYRAEYEEYCREERSVQVSLANGAFTLVGLPPKGCAERLRKKMAK